MNSPKMVTVIFLSFLTFAVWSQSDKGAVKYFQDNIDRTSIRKMLFFEHELIAACEDSSFRRKLLLKINKQYNAIETNTDELARKERIIFLSILRKRIEDVETSDKLKNEVKTFLIAQLSKHKIDFPVDTKLIEGRLNPNTRGLPFGDEECDEEFSHLVFFLYCSDLYIKVLKQMKPKGEPRFPTTCVLAELNLTPLPIKKKVQAELLKSFQLRKGVDYDFIRDLIKNADLNASYD